MPIYWGDLHNHCGITYGYGSLENALAAAREQLDFCTVIGHAMWPDMPARTAENAFSIDFHEKGFQKLRDSWDAVRDTIAKANKSGQFVTFQGYEMHSSRYGDHHFVSMDDDLPLIEESTPAALVEQLRSLGKSVIAIPHHIAYTKGYRAISWPDFNELVSPLVEIYSKHGCGLSEDSPFAYYHTMGPRDSKSTAMAGLLAGKRFGFVGSTDHHAGYPGSYGDGLVAVMAEEKTRSAIWDALLRRQTYAVTGDKIECSWSANDAVMGGVANAAGSRQFRLAIKGWDMLERIVVYKNMQPWKAWTEADLQKTHSDTFCIRVEMGWGRSTTGYDWKGGLRVNDGRIIASESGFRGMSVLRPDPELIADDRINALNNRLLRSDDQELAWTCTTFRNPSPQQSATAHIMAKVEGDEATQIQIENNGKSVSLTIKELLEGGQAFQMNPTYHGDAFLVHRAIPQYQHSFDVEFTDESASGDEDVYYVEVRQKNGQTAWLSPIYFAHQSGEQR